MNVKLTNKGRRLLIEREGKRNYAYPDPASPLYAKGSYKAWGFKPAREIIERMPPAHQELSGAPWTCGVGITGPDVTMDTFWTEKQVDQKFAEHCAQFEAQLCNLLEGGADTSSDQFDAMLSLMFNIGVNNFAKSTVLRKHRQGDYPAAARAFKLFNKARGQVSPALEVRRAAEAAQYSEGLKGATVDDVPVDTLPPTPDKESSLAVSQINVAAVTAGATAAVTGTAQLLDAMKGNEVAFALLAVTVLCALIVFWRARQRDGGWA